MKSGFKTLPGWLGTTIITLLNGLWMVWGIGEAFYEGWGVPETPWFLYMSIVVAALLFSVLAILFPYIGGGLLVLAGLAFAIWWLLPGISQGLYTLSTIVGRLFLSAGFTIVGVMFILDGSLNPREKGKHKPWILKNVRLLVAIGIPIVIGAIIAACNLPTVLTRMDDGDRSARLIEGKDVALVWAPEGPGWNWKQDFGGYPSWDALASYGIEPIELDTDKLPDRHADESDMAATGLCAYLDESGENLMDAPQYIWRMPSVEEIAGSLALHHENAGCTWYGEDGKLDCTLNPDKETPLWAPDDEPVYYWAADAYNDEEAYYVSYTGYVNYQPKSWGNPRHGYRCVKEP